MVRFKVMFSKTSELVAHYFKNCKPINTNSILHSSQKIGGAGRMRLVTPAWQQLAGAEVG